MIDIEERRIAARLLHLRSSFEISQEQLAYALDIGVEELSSYENAKVAIPASLLALASIALGVEYDYFYEESGTLDIPSTPVLTSSGVTTPLLLS